MTSTGMEGNAQNQGDHLYLETCIPQKGSGWPTDGINHSKQGRQQTLASTKLQTKHTADKKGLKKRTTKSTNTSDVQCPYNLRSQQSRNKQVNCVKDDAWDEQGDDIEN